MPKHTEHDPPPGHAAPRAGPGYEVRDVDVKFVRMIVYLLITLTAGGLLASFAVVEVMNRIRARHPAEISPLANTLPERPPEPRLQVSAPLDLNEARAAETATLNSYAWIDEKGGIVRIPIERAMELVARRGLPARAEPPAGQPAGQGAKQ
jgi:hypothetical protein